MVCYPQGKDKLKMSKYRVLRENAKERDHLGELVIGRIKLRWIMEKCIKVWVEYI